VGASISDFITLARVCRRLRPSPTSPKATDHWATKAIRNDVAEDIDLSVGEMAKGCRELKGGKGSVVFPRSWAKMAW
jgi:hypothetical protein